MKFQSLEIEGNEYRSGFYTDALELRIPEIGLVELIFVMFVKDSPVGARTDPLHDILRSFSIDLSCVDR